MDEQLRTKFLRKMYPFNATAVRRANPKAMCLIAIDANGLIRRSNAVSTPWDGRAKFDQWFRDVYQIDVIEDGGEAYYESREIAVEAA